jgi:hypothetical protein
LMNAPLVGITNNADLLSDKKAESHKDCKGFYHMIFTNKSGREA